MTLNIYTVLDVKAGSYMLPFPMQNDGLAVRAMQDLTNDPDHVFCKHANDFFLYKVGTWDDQDGNISGFKVPQRIASMHDIRDGQVEI